MRNKGLLMKKYETKTLIEKSIENNNLSKILFRFNNYYESLFPVAYSDKLFMSVNEYDFSLDGYSIYRFKDVKSIKSNNNIFEEIIKSEGLIDSITIPAVDITNWKTIFESLKIIDKNIIVEKNTIDEKNSEFIIGRIEKIYKNFAYVRNFDANGIWDNSPTKIPFTEITKITFNSRYINFFSKHLNELTF